MPQMRDSRGRFISGPGGNSNIDHVTSWLQNFVDSFDFTRPGNDQSLGRDVANKVVERIAERAKQKTGVDPESGTVVQWKENAPKVKEWKASRYGVDDAPNKRTGDMLSAKKLFGRTKIDRKEITMIYGTDEAPDSSLTGAELSEQDKTTTDVEKAYFAHTGQSDQRIKRPFYGINADDAKAVSELMQESLNQMIRDENARNGY